MTGNIDFTLHDVRDSLDKLKWRKYRGRPYEWYYAEKGLYIVRRIYSGVAFVSPSKPPMEVYFVTASSPQRAIEKVLKMKEAAEHGKSGDDQHQV